MKKVMSLAFALMLTVSLLAFGIPANAADVSDFTYEIENGQVTITDCNYDTSSKLVIPETIEGYPVTTIGDSAFSSCDSLESIHIPSSVTAIGRGVFDSCSSLSEIEVSSTNPNYSSKDGVLFNKDKTVLIRFPEGKSGAYAILNSVKTIDENAFQFCTYLTSVSIPDSVTHIGNSAFWNCTSLKSLTIPKSVVTIGTYAFVACEALTEINVASGNPNYSSKDGVLFSKGKDVLIHYPIAKSDTHYSIPNSVATIESAAFHYCKSLTTITIPNSVTTIRNQTFYRCASLTYVTIPDSVTTIGDGAFSECTSLTTVTIGNGVIHIGAHAFSHCNSMTSLTLGKGVTSIGEFAFCDSLMAGLVSDIYFAGSEEDRARIDGIDHNSTLNKATWHYNCEIPDTEPNTAAPTLEKESPDREEGSHNAVVSIIIAVSATVSICVICATVIVIILKKKKQ